MFSADDAVAGSSVKDSTAAVNTERIDATARKEQPAAHKRYAGKSAELHSWTLAFVDDTLETHFRQYCIMKTSVKTKWASLAFAFAVLTLAALEQGYGYISTTRGRAALASIRGLTALFSIVFFISRQSPFATHRAVERTLMRMLLLQLAFLVVGDCVAAREEGPASTFYGPFQWWSTSFYMIHVALMLIAGIRFPILCTVALLEPLLACISFAVLPISAYSINSDMPVVMCCTIIGCLLVSHRRETVERTELVALLNVSADKKMREELLNQMLPKRIKELLQYGNEEGGASGHQEDHDDEGALERMGSTGGGLAPFSSPSPPPPQRRLSSGAIDVLSNDSLGRGGTTSAAAAATAAAAAAALESDGGVVELGSSGSTAAAQPEAHSLFHAPSLAAMNLNSFVSQLTGVVKRVQRPSLTIESTRALAPAAAVTPVTPLSITVGRARGTSATAAGSSSSAWHKMGDISDRSSLSMDTSMAPSPVVSHCSSGGSNCHHSSTSSSDNDQMDLSRGAAAGGMTSVDSYERTSAASDRSTAVREHRVRNSSVAGLVASAASSATSVAASGLPHRGSASSIVEHAEDASGGQGAPAKGNRLFKSMRRILMGGASTSAAATAATSAEDGNDVATANAAANSTTVNSSSSSAVSRKSSSSKRRMSVHRDSTKSTGDASFLSDKSGQQPSSILASALGTTRRQSLAVAGMLNLGGMGPIASAAAAAASFNEDASGKATARREVRAIKFEKRDRAALARRTSYATLGGGGAAGSMAALAMSRGSVRSDHESFGGCAGSDDPVAFRSRVAITHPANGSISSSEGGWVPAGSGNSPLVAVPIGGGSGGGGDGSLYSRSSGPGGGNDTPPTAASFFGRGRGAGSVQLSNSRASISALVSQQSVSRAIGDAAAATANGGPRRSSMPDAGVNTTTSSSSSSSSSSAKQKPRAASVEAGAARRLPPPITLQLISTGDETSVVAPVSRGGDGAHRSSASSSAGSIAVTYISDAETSSQSRTGGPSSAADGGRTMSAIIITAASAAAGGGIGGGATAAGVGGVHALSLAGRSRSLDEDLVAAGRRAAAAPPDRRSMDDRLMASVLAEASASVTPRCSPLPGYVVSNETEGRLSVEGELARSASRRARLLHPGAGSANTLLSTDSSPRLLDADNVDDVLGGVGDKPMTPNGRYGSQKEKHQHRSHHHGGARRHSASSAPDYSARTASLHGGAADASTESRGGGGGRDQEGPLTSLPGGGDGGPKAVPSRKPSLGTNFLGGIARLLGTDRPSRRSLISNDAPAAGSTPVPAAVDNLSTRRSSYSDGGDGEESLGSSSLDGPIDSAPDRVHAPKPSRVNSSDQPYTIRTLETIASDEVEGGTERGPANESADGSSRRINPILTVRSRRPSITVTPSPLGPALPVAAAAAVAESGREASAHADYTTTPVVGMHAAVAPPKRLPVHDLTGKPRSILRKSRASSQNDGSSLALDSTHSSLPSPAPAAASHGGDGGANEQLAFEVNGANGRRSGGGGGSDDSLHRHSSISSTGPSPGGTNSQQQQQHPQQHLQQQLQKRVSSTSVVSGGGGVGGTFAAWFGGNSAASRRRVSAAGALTARSSATAADGTPSPGSTYSRGGGADAGTGDGHSDRFSVKTGQDASFRLEDDRAQIDNVALGDGAGSGSGHTHAATAAAADDGDGESDTSEVMGQAIAHSFPEVTVMFVYINNLNYLSGKADPIELVTFLNRLYTCFDTLVEETGVYKVMAIANMYLCVAGALDDNVKHAETMAETALRIMKMMKRDYTLFRLADEDVEIQIGLHTGEVAAGVIGTRTFNWHIFGDTVNTASRMCSNSMPGRVQLSPITAAKLQRADDDEAAAAAEAHAPPPNRHFRLTQRGPTFFKGKGVIVTTWLSDNELEGLTMAEELRKLKESRAKAAARAVAAAASAASQQQQLHSSFNTEDDAGGTFDLKDILSLGPIRSAKPNGAGPAATHGLAFASRGGGASGGDSAATAMTTPGGGPLSGGGTIAAATISGKVLPTLPVLRGLFGGRRADGTTAGLRPIAAAVTPSVSAVGLKPLGLHKSGGGGIDDGGSFSLGAAALNNGGGNTGDHEAVQMDATGTATPTPPSSAVVNTTAAAASSSSSTPAGTPGGNTPTGSTSGRGGPQSGQISGRQGSSKRELAGAGCDSEQLQATPYSGRAAKKRLKRGQGHSGDGSERGGRSSDVYAGGGGGALASVRNLFMSSWGGGGSGNNNNGDGGGGSSGDSSDRMSTPLSAHHPSARSSVRGPGRGAGALASVRNLLMLPTSSPDKSDFPSAASAAAYAEHHVAQEALRMLAFANGDVTEAIPSTTPAPNKTSSSLFTSTLPSPAIRSDVSGGGFSIGATESAGAARPRGRRNSVSGTTGGAVNRMASSRGLAMAQSKRNLQHNQAMGGATYGSVRYLLMGGGGSGAGGGPSMRASVRNLTTAATGSSSAAPVPPTPPGVNTPKATGSGSGTYTGFPTTGTATGYGSLGKSSRLGLGGAFSMASPSASTTSKLGGLLWRSGTSEGNKDGSSSSSGGGAGAASGSGTHREGAHTPSAEEDACNAELARVLEADENDSPHKDKGPSLAFNAAPLSATPSGSSTPNNGGGNGLRASMRWIQRALQPDGAPHTTSTASSAAAGSALSSTGKSTTLRRTASRKYPCSDLNHHDGFGPSWSKSVKHIIKHCESEATQADAASMASHPHSAANSNSGSNEWKNTVVHNFTESEIVEHSNKPAVKRINKLMDVEMLLTQASAATPRLPIHLISAHSLVSTVESDMTSHGSRNGGPTGILKQHVSNSARANVSKRLLDSMTPAPSAVGNDMAVTVLPGEVVVSPRLSGATSAILVDRVTASSFSSSTAVARHAQEQYPSSAALVVPPSTRRAQEPQHQSSPSPLPRVPTTTASLIKLAASAVSRDSRSPTISSSPVFVPPSLLPRVPTTTAEMMKKQLAAEQGDSSAHGGGWKTPVLAMRELHLPTPAMQAYSGLDTTTARVNTLDANTGLDCATGVITAFDAAAAAATTAAPADVSPDALLREIDAALGLGAPTPTQHSSDQQYQQYQQQRQQQQHPRSPANAFSLSPTPGTTPAATPPLFGSTSPARLLPQSATAAAALSSTPCHTHGDAAHNRRTSLPNTFWKGAGATGTGNTAGGAAAVPLTAATRAGALLGRPRRHSADMAFFPAELLLPTPGTSTAAPANAKDTWAASTVGTYGSALIGSRESLDTNDESFLAGSGVDDGAEESGSPTSSVESAADNDHEGSSYLLPEQALNEVALLPRRRSLWATMGCEQLAASACMRFDRPLQEQSFQLKTQVDASSLLRFAFTLGLIFALASAVKTLVFRPDLLAASGSSGLAPLVLARILLVVIATACTIAVTVVYARLAHGPAAAGTASRGAAFHRMARSFSQSRFLPPHELLSLTLCISFCVLYNVSLLPVFANVDNSELSNLNFTMMVVSSFLEMRAALLAIINAACFLIYTGLFITSYLQNPTPDNNDMASHIMIVLGGAVLSTVAGYMRERSRRSKFLVSHLARRQKLKCERLLINMLPSMSHVERLMAGEQVVEVLEDVTMLYSDIKGFTEMSSKLTPEELIRFLDSLYTAFDQHLEPFKLYKIETIGDAFIVIGGMTNVTAASGGGAAVHHDGATSGTGAAVAITASTGDAAVAHTCNKTEQSSSAPNSDDHIPVAVINDTVRAVHGGRGGGGGGDALSPPLAIASGSPVLLLHDRVTGGGVDERCDTGRGKGHAEKGAPADAASAESSGLSSWVRSTLSARDHDEHTVNAIAESISSAYPDAVDSTTREGFISSTMAKLGRVTPRSTTPRSAPAPAVADQLLQARQSSRTKSSSHSDSRSTTENATDGAAAAAAVEPDWGNPPESIARQPLSHCGAVALFAMDMLREIACVRAETAVAVELRIGIHTGKVVGGIIGKSRPRYFIWGQDTIVANRMESTGIPGQIQVSEVSARRLHVEGFVLEKYQQIDTEYGSEHGGKTTMPPSIPVPPLTGAGGASSAVVLKSGLNLATAPTPSTASTTTAASTMMQTFLVRSYLTPDGGAELTVLPPTEPEKK